MPKVVKPEYPTELTVKYWDKKKGILARISKVKTGISEELTKTLKLFDAVPWEKLDLHAFLPTKYDRKTLDLALKKFESETSGPVNAAYKGMRSLENFLTSKAKELGKDEKTKQFEKDVQTMAAAAKTFSFAIAPGTLSGPITAEYKICVAGIEKREEVLKNTNGIYKNYVVKALKATIEAAKKPMTPEKYVAHWSENLRGIGTCAAGVAQTYPEVKVPLGEAKTQWVQSNMPSTPEAVAEQLKKDLEILKKFGAIAQKIPA